MRRASPRGVLLILGIATLASMAMSLSLGAFRIPFSEIPGLLASQAGFGEATDPGKAAVFWQLRVPRVLMALLVGASLAVAGALLQGLFRNPLADPALIGISSGAALGAVTVIVLGSVLFPSLVWLSDARFLPLAAFAGALAITYVIYRLASSGGYTAVATLLLAGLAINALVSSVIGLATFLATDVQLRTLSFWSLGSLGSAAWDSLFWLAPMTLLLLVAAPWFAGALNAMALGESEAGHLGFRLETLKGGILVLTAAGVGACVAFTGMIAFVGLVVPHLVRLWIGPDHRWLVPGSAMLGAVLLLLADTAARTIAAPAEVPIGILTAAFGAPFFLGMLLKRRGRAVWG